MIGKLLLVGAGGVVAIGGAVDVWAKGMAADKIAERAEAAAGGQAEASADIDSVPFLLKLLTSGDAGDISVTVEDVTTAQVDLARVTLDLRGVRLDKGRLLSDRKAEVTDIGSGTLTVRFDANAVTKALGGRVPITVQDGRVQATVAGRTITAEVRMATPRAVLVSVAGVGEATIPVPQTSLVSCPSGDVAVDGDEIRVSCTLEEVPPALLRAAQGALSR